MYKYHIFKEYKIQHLDENDDEWNEAAREANINEILYSR